MVSEGRESRSCFAGWIRCRVSHKGIGKLLTMAAVISKLTHVALGILSFLAGWRIEASAPGHMGLSPGLLTTQ